ncbi:hypothetical protein ASE93_19070 [Serratia sp. Leaf50]|nr:hypothetical protein ASE93_19070 [Serratia sp. Leaf50]
MKITSSNGDKGGALSYRSDSPDIASVEKDGKVTAIAKGTAKITVTEAASANYLGQAVTADVSVDLNDAPVLTAKAVEVDWGTANVKLDVKGGNEGPYIYQADPAGVVEVSKEGKLTLLKAGTTRIKVSQVATPTTAAPEAIEVKVTVRKILGTALKAEPMTLKIDQTDKVKITSSNGDKGGALSYRSDSPDIASVDSKGKVTAIAKGTAKITVTEAASANYLGQAVTADVSVDLNDAPVLTAKAVEVDWGTANVELGVKGGNEGPYIYQADPADVVKVSDKGKLTLLKAGTTRIKVSQAATASMAAPEAIEVKVTVRKILGTALKAESMTLKIDQTDKVKITSSNGDKGGALSYRSDSPDIASVDKVKITSSNGDKGGALSYRSDSPDIASVDSKGKVTAKAQGSAKVTVTEAESANYLGQTATADVSVGLNDAPVLTAKDVEVNWGTANVELGVKGGNEGPYIYQADPADVVKVSDKGKLTLLKAGTTRIKVSQAATASMQRQIDASEGRYDPYQGQSGGNGKHGGAGGYRSQGYR